MKIDANRGMKSTDGLNSVSNTDTKLKKDLEKLGTNSASSAGVGNATVDFSSRAKDAQKALNIAKDSDGVDAAKVAKFRDLIDKGQYKVDAEAVADKLVDQHVEWAAMDADTE